MDHDTQVGLDAMRIFHNRSLKFSGYSYTFDGYLAAFGSGAMVYAEGIGLAIRSTGLSNARVKEAMEGLADQSGGRLPKFQAYMNAIQGVAGQIDYIALTKDVATEVAVKTGEGLASFGENVLVTLKSLNVLFPIVIVGGALWIAYSKIKKVAK